MSQMYVFRVSSRVVVQRYGVRQLEGKWKHRPLFALSSDRFHRQGVMRQLPLMVINLLRALRAYLNKVLSRTLVFTC
jgi:hypothetical protein